MKDIVVAIDFSSGSIHALEYAIGFANHQKSNLLMIWVNNQLTGEYGVTDNNQERDEAVQNFEDLLQRFSPMLTHGKLSYKIRKGKVYQEIAAQAKQVNAGLIIAGTHGITGYEEFWIGSNAYRIVSYAPCPVITVRYDFLINPRGVANILVPIDSTADTIQKIPYTTQLANELGAGIHLLEVHTTNLKSMQRRVQTNALTARKHMENAGIQCTVSSITADNITNGILDYAQAVSADLIAIMTEQETSANNILLGPFAQQLVNYSQIPVLSIQPKEIYEISTR